MLLLCAPPGWPAQSTQSRADRFELAWQAANRGQRAEFESLRDGLQGYVLYPYLQYEDLRHRRTTVAADEMAAFLAAHPDWAFTEALRTSWLRALGRAGHWRDLHHHAAGGAPDNGAGITKDINDAEIRCHVAHARLRLGATDGLEAQAQDLWAVGHSQHDACDPVFEWLQESGGITPELAWLRIRRAMAARNPRLTRYLARFVPATERIWAERWQQQDHAGYRRLDRAQSWPDEAAARDIIEYGLTYLARKDPDHAWRLFERLDGHVAWDSGRRAKLMAELALWSAVGNAPDTTERMHAVPAAGRSDRVLQWWARNGLATGNWAEVILAIAAMSEDARASERWRYWDARARLEMGDPDYAHTLLEGLATSASYYGFLAADLLQRPYAICPHEAAVDAEQLVAFRERPEMRRILELDRVGLRNWSRAEWRLAMRRSSAEELRLAAALATQEDWPDLAILALAGSGDQQWYDWRFPIGYAPLVAEQAERRNLDVAWVMGLMRSESAMAVDAVSPAGARGLMQLMPATATQLARRHSFAFRGTEQLMRAEDNVVFGTTFLRELMDRFGENPVLVAGAYNAGPGAVRRWLENLPRNDPAVWVEVLPFFETRDYIPRVLAFATIYDWRLQLPVRRVTARMPPLESGTMAGVADSSGVAAVACPTPIAGSVPGS